MDENLTFGARLRKARKDYADLTQQELSERSGVPQQAISRIEQGKQDTSASTAQLAHACGVSPLWLATGEGNMIGSSEIPAKTATGEAVSIEAKQVSALLDPQIQQLVEDFGKLPEGWRYYIARKTGRLCEIAEKLPAFVKDSFRTIPEESRYWEWERKFNDYINEQDGIVEDDGYLGPERRAHEAPVVEERRVAYQVSRGAKYSEGRKVTRVQSAPKKGDKK